MEKEIGKNSNDDNEPIYYFIPASTGYYTNNNFDDLLKEENKYKGSIYWKISYNDNKMIRKISSGNKKNICLIYYSNLPDGTSRILFYGIIEDSDYDKSDKIHSICKDAGNHEKYIKMKITSLCLKENQDMFSLENLRAKYGIKKGQISYQVISKDNPQQKLLIEEVEKFKHPGSKLKEVNNYFNDNYCACIFKKSIKDRHHETFIEQNGFYFVNEHHLVEKSLIKKYEYDKEIVNAINDKRNLFKLCPNCHMEIHHGKLERRRTLINYLYKKEKSFFDENFQKLAKNKTVLDWLYEMYKCN